MITAEAPATPSGKILTGRMVLIYILAFFGVVIAVNGVMMKLAIDTLSGTVVDGAYAVGNAYNQELKAARAQAERGWQVAAHVDRYPDSAVSVRIDARDRAGGPVSGMAFSAQLARPADKRGDRFVTLSDIGGGAYRGSAEDVAPGQWDLIIQAERGGERVFLSRNRLVLQ